MDPIIPSQPPLLITFDEAAVLLSVSPRTVRRMVSRGELDVVRITPDAPRIRYTDLVARVESRESAP